MHPLGTLLRTHLSYELQRAPLSVEEKSFYFYEPGFGFRLGLWERDNMGMKLGMSWDWTKQANWRIELHRIVGMKTTPVLHRIVLLETELATACREVVTEVCGDTAFWEIWLLGGWGK